MFGASVAIGASMLLHKYHYNNTPPLSNLIQTPRSVVVKEGDPYPYQAIYDKRDDCQSVGGHYRIEGLTSDGDRIDLIFRKRAKGNWPVGNRQVANVVVSLPKSIIAGKYNMWWTWTYDCDRASKQMTVVSPRMPVYVSER